MKFITLLIACLMATPHAHAGNMDPLDSTEQATAEALVRGELKAGSAARQESQTESSPSNPELLLIERHRLNDKHSNERSADVYLYDYNTDETIIYRVDTGSGQVLSTTRQQQFQLPLTESEIERATQLIFGDQEILKLVQDEYQKITGQVLNSPSQLQTRAFVFTADTLPERLNQASQQCGLHRCAQILMYTHDSVVFEVSPIVNLSAKIITQVSSF